MGDRGTRRRWSAWQLWAAAATAMMMAAAIGCASAPSSTAQTLQEEGAQAASPTAPVEIGSIELRELAPGAELELIADGPLVWTQYRDAEDNLVLELPNSILGPGVSDLAPAEGLVEAVDVEQQENGTRPLTRLVIRTREEAEHSLTVEDRVLNLRLAPVGAEAPTTLAFEPLPEQEPVARAEEVQPPPPTPAGTPEQPYVAPTPVGVRATQLQGIELLAADDVTVVRVVGDGEFAYSTFDLENPERFVIDLDGVVNVSTESMIPIETQALERIRMAQFKPHPEPVARVVFDLREPTPAVVERSGDGLTVRFGGGPPGVAAEMAEPLPEEAPEVVVDVPPEAPDVEVEQPPGEVETPEPVVAQEMAAPEEFDAEVMTEVVQPEVTEEVPAPAVEEPLPPTTDVALFEAQDVEIAAPETTEEAAPQTFDVQALGGQREYFGEPISMSLKDADITEVLRSIARISGLNIVIQPGVSGPVTVELDRVPWDQALDQILKINNLGMQLDGNILRIAPIAQLRAEAEEQLRLEQAKALSIPLRTVLKRISYASANEIARILTTGSGTAGGVMSQRGSVTVDPRTNTLIIKELPAFLDVVLQVIQNLDIPEPQVMIEARIVETTKNFSRSLGIQWDFSGVADAEHGNTTGLEFPNNITADGGVQLLTGGANAFLNIGLGNVLNTFELDVALIAAENEGLINVISAPKVATLNNQQASIQTGLQIPIQTVANNTVTVQFVNATLRLSVTPHVTAEGTVLMDINIQKREPQLAFAVVGATNAPIATREARTRVIVRDGGTTVIGGIYEVTTNQRQDRVPGLANIPILGHLFKNKARDNTNEELLIFITPRVMQI